MRNKIVLLGIPVLLLLSCSLFSSRPSYSVRNNGFPLSSSWNISLDSHVDALATENDLVALADQNTLRVVQLPSLTTLWEDDFSILSDLALAVSNGNVYAVNSSELRAYDGKTGRILWKTMRGTGQGRPEILSVTDREVFLLINTEWVVQAYDEASGNILWEVPSGRGGADLIPNPNENIVYLLRNEEIAAYGGTSGTLVWEQPASGITGPGLFFSGILYYYVADSTFPNRSGEVFALNTVNNTEIWHTASIPQANAISVFDQKLIVSTENGIVVINLLDGAIEWISSSEDDFQTRAVTVNKIIYARAANTNKIYAIDLATGKTVGSLSGEPTSIKSANNYVQGISKADDYLVFSLGNVIYGYALHQ